MSRTPSSTKSGRYSLRKRPPVRFRPSYGEQDVSFDLALEALLAHHEEEGIKERAAKRQKKLRKRQRGDGEGSRAFPSSVFSDEDESLDATEDDDEGPPHLPLEEIPFDQLPSPCIVTILEMLPTPRDLHNLCFANKYVLSHLDSTIVIRSAVNEDFLHRDARAPKVVGGIIQQVQDRSIRVPSTLRLLRLLNATRCERGELCFGYDLISRAPSRLHTYGRFASSRPFGLSLCPACVKASTVGIQRFYGHFGRDEDRVCTFQWNQAFQPQPGDEVDCDGEKVGPFLHARHLLQIESTYRRDDRKAALKRLIETVYGEVGSKEREEYENKAAQLVDIYRKAEEDKDDYIAAEERRKNEEWQSKRDDRIARRLARVRPMFYRLESLLADAPLKDVALDVAWDQESHNCLVFHATFMSETMRHLLNAPASATQKAIGNVAEQIRSDLDTLSTNEEFFTFSFLEGTTNSTKKAMHEYVKNHMSEKTALLRDPQADARFISLLRQKHYVTALVRILRSDPDRLPLIISKAFVKDEPNLDKVEKHRSLARAVWRKFERDMPRGRDWTLSEIGSISNSSRAEFREMKAASKRYLSCTATVAWLNSTNNIGIGVGGFTRQDAIDQVFNPKFTNVRSHGPLYGVPLDIANAVPYECLRTRNFDTLLQVHQYYFRIGRA